MTIYNGTNGNDEFDGTENADTISGGKGDDKLYGNGGNDTIYGEGAEYENNGTGTGTIFEGSITVDNLLDNMDIVTVTARSIKNDGTLSIASEAKLSTTANTASGMAGFGVKGTPESGIAGQLGYDPSEDVSEEVIVDFDYYATAADFKVSNLFLNEGDSRGNAAGDEVGHYAVYKDGVLVAEADFTANVDGSSNEAHVTIELPDDACFDRIVFTATPYSETNGDVLTDSSDYWITELNYTASDVACDCKIDHCPTGSFDDLITGGEGDDIIFGQLGDDSLHGGAGDDEISGGVGNDIVHGNDGNDILDGGNGDDIMEGGNGHDVMDAGCGDDQMQGEGGNDLMFGGSGDDMMEGNSGEDIMFGGSGNDAIYGEDDNDTITGGEDRGTINVTTEEIACENENETCGEDKEQIFNVTTADKNVDINQTLQAWSSEGVTVKALKLNLNDNSTTAKSFGTKNVKFDINSSHTLDANLHGSYEYAGLAVAGGIDGGETDTLNGNDHDCVEMLRVEFDDAVDMVNIQLSALFDGEKIIDFDNSPFDKDFVEQAKLVLYGENGETEEVLVEGNTTGLVNAEISTTFKILSVDIYPLDDGAGNSGKNSDFLLRSVSGSNFTEECDLLKTTVTYTIGDDLYGGNGADKFIYRAGDGVDKIWDFNPYEGDTLEIYGFDGFTNVIVENGQTILILGEDQAIILNDTYVMGENDAIEGISFFEMSEYDDGYVEGEAEAELCDAECEPHEDSPKPPSEEHVVEIISDPNDCCDDEEPIYRDSYIKGTNNHDDLVGTYDDDFIDGFGGNDNLCGKAGDDWLIGGKGNDMLKGGAGSDNLVGGEDADIFVLDDLGGADIIHDFRIEEGDMLRMPEGVSYAVNKIDDFHAQIEFENGTTVTLWGVSANDFVVNPENYIEGMDSSSSSLENPLMVPGTGWFGAGDKDDVIQGNDGDNTITGGNGNDTIFGGNGNDFLVGDAGDDTLNGGMGDDNYYAGTGADRFDFTGDVGGNDQIHDFSTSDGDLLLLNESNSYTIEALESDGWTAQVLFDSGASITLWGIDSVDMAEHEEDYILIG